jgi:hypothetical protein
MTFDVSTVWKGPVQKQIVVETSVTGGSCGWHGQSDVEYVIFAETGPNGKLRTSSCSGNEVLAQSAAPSELGRGTAPSSTATVESKTTIAPKTQLKTPSDSRVHSPTTATTTLPKEKTSFIAWLRAKIQVIFSSWFAM